MVNKFGETEGGKRGPPGPPGIAGPPGKKGDRGTGDPGPKGDRGDRGSKGETGVKGLPGKDGIQGPKGDRGTRGDQGLRGLPGDKGDTGLKGEHGNKGEQGARGLTGDQGARGVGGRQGIQGKDGVQGADGADGPVGKQGVQGQVGVDGAVGPQGVQGQVGAVGPVGKQGVQGQNGEIGPPGVLSTFFFNTTILDGFSREMILSYFFDTDKSGLLEEDGKAVGLKNQVGKTRHALVKGKVGKMIKYPGCGKYSLKFTTEIYEVKGDISLSLEPGGKSIIILNFKVDEVPKLSYIFTTMYVTRTLFLDGKQIVLDCGKGQHRLPYDVHRWNFVYIELNKPAVGEMDSIFRVNDQSAVLRIFSSERVDETLFIGGTMDGKGAHYFKGQIGRFEIFERICEEGRYVNFPENIRNSYIEKKYETLL